MWQQANAEALAQLALFAPSREVLLKNPHAIAALEAVAERGLTPEAQAHARGALHALRGFEQNGAARPGGREEGAAGHVMVSYQWDVQAIVEKIVRSLQRRGYQVWFDLYCMKGSTMDAMSDAVDKAEVMLYGASLAYKESGNCRMEANYAHRQNVDMIPLMMQKDYNAKGWLGMILGTRLWYNFFDAKTDNEPSFEKRVDAVCREIGERGKLKTTSAAAVPEIVSPAPPPAPTVPGPPAPPAPAAPPPAATPQHVAPTTADQTFTPSMQAMSPQAGLTTPTERSSSFAPSIHQLDQILSSPVRVAGSADSVALVTMLMDQQQLMREREANLTKKIEAKTEKMEAKMQRQLTELEAKLAPRPAVSMTQLTDVLGRLEALHAAQLLTEAEHFSLEDLVTDFIELQASSGPITEEMLHLHHTAARVHKMVAVSTTVPSDATFARQLRRKYV
jgi:hypothetical protein